MRDFVLSRCPLLHFGSSSIHRWLHLACGKSEFANLVDPWPSVRGCSLAVAVIFRWLSRRLECTQLDSGVVSTSSGFVRQWDTVCGWWSPETRSHVITVEITQEASKTWAIRSTRLQSRKPHTRSIR